MYVTVAEYAAMCGVSPETIEWLISDVDTRPISLSYVDVPPVFAAPGTFARLWGAGDMAVRYQIQRGVIPLREADVWTCMRAIWLGGLRIGIECNGRPISTHRSSACS